MPSYLIAIVRRIHPAACASSERHNERNATKYPSNPDIKQELSEQNYHLVQPADSYRNLYRKRIAETGCKERKSSVVLVEFMVTASPEYIQELHRSGKDRLFFERAQEFLAQELNEDNAVSAVVHLDETNPHLHSVFVPIAFDREKQHFHLSACAFLPDLTAWQERFYLHMKKDFPKIQHGIPKSKTGNQHISMPLFKQGREIEKYIRELAVTGQELTLLNYKRKRSDLAESIRTSKDFQFLLSLPRSLSIKENTIERLEDRIGTYQENMNSLKIKLEREKVRTAGLSSTLSDLKSKRISLRQPLPDLSKENTEPLPSVSLHAPVQRHTPER